MSYTPLDLNALASFKVEPVEWIIDGVAAAGSLILCHGREKSGKGLLSIDMGGSTSSGEDFLDRSVTQCPVLYCFGEENIREVQSRVFARVGPLRDIGFHVLPLNGQTQDRFNLEDPLSLSLLVDAIDRTGARYIILDTLREFHNRAEDSSDDMAPLIKPLRQIAHEKNVAIQINHHQNKSGTSRGSTAIAAAVDQVISLVRTDQNPHDAPDPNSMPKAILSVEGRFGPRLVLHMQLNSDMRWRPTNEVTTNMDLHLGARIEELFKNSNELLDASAIAERTKGNQKTVQNILSKLLKLPSPPVIAQGNGTKNAPRLYRSTNPMIPGLGNDGNDDGSHLEGNDSHNGSHGNHFHDGNHFGGNQRVTPALESNVDPPSDCPSPLCKSKGACPSFVKSGMCDLATYYASGVAA